MEKTPKIESDDLYNLIFNVDKPVDLINLILSQFENKYPNKLAKRKKVENKNVDIDFYKKTI